ncbi:MAG: hypothetical protein UV80_C0003G0018 [Candidatus Peregrinibacteria bacterium GW2011_GWF2_43_17]|nr:MAG: hypothetical protein UV80_C0003G0018 [Candidatus Peregrinibacteria bacterium GW2011_GWF2_43_17]KKT19339.1 MAG: hypothetical protein UW03_C0020G0044 [Candidatus Peregrinibacteria bacterium GW2011_GWA2_43_8]HAU40155.1 hypothetical protein [Candidatus Peregrinibacteria bacterium]
MNFELSGAEKQRVMDGFQPGMESAFDKTKEALEEGIVKEGTEVFDHGTVVRFVKMPGSGKHVVNRQDGSRVEFSDCMECEFRVRGYDEVLGDTGIEVVRIRVFRGEAQVQLVGHEPVNLSRIPLSVEFEMGNKGDSVTGLPNPNLSMGHRMYRDDVDCMSMVGLADLICSKIVSAVNVLEIDKRKGLTAPLSRIRRRFERWKAGI